MPYFVDGSPYDREQERLEREADARWRWFFSGLFLGICFAIIL